MLPFSTSIGHVAGVCLLGPLHGLPVTLQGTTNQVLYSIPSTEILKF